eukprot:2830015-Pleurochrysis_carterae.AAC.3
MPCMPKCDARICEIYYVLLIRSFLWETKLRASGSGFPSRNEQSMPVEQMQHSTVLIMMKRRA